jgi:nucleoside-diphosphate-sugar epimerase
MKILITGATGFLGGAIVADLLGRGLGASLLLQVRAADAAAGLGRIRGTLRNFQVPEADIATLSESLIVCGDLEHPDRFLADGRLHSVTHVINSAALATFSNNPKLWPINVDGTFAFAKRMAGVKSLKRFVHIGTAMSCGPGLASPIAESWELPPPEEHLVPYTATKAEIEMRMHRELPGLPLVVVRPSIVVGHTKLGCAPSGSIFWVFRMAQELERFTCALDEKIDVVPVDYCAQIITELAMRPEIAHDLYHISAGTGHSCTFGEIDIALARAKGIEPVGARYQVVREEDMASLAEDFRAKCGPCNRRLIVRALRLYGGFARLNYLFDNRRLLAEGLPPTPRMSDFIDVCTKSSMHVNIQDQMHWDFK